MTGGTSKTNHEGQTPTLKWTSTVFRPDAEAKGDEVVRVIPVVPGAMKKAWEFGSSLGEVRSQIKAAAKALRPHAADLQGATILAPAGWARIPWPSDISLSEFDPEEQWAAEIDISKKVKALRSRVEIELGPDLARLPCKRTVFGVDFVDPEDHDNGEQWWEAQLLLVYERSESGGSIVHATTKFGGSGVNTWMLTDRNWSRRVWRNNGLLNCHDLVTIGQNRREPTNPELKTRRKAVTELLDERGPKRILHIAHTLGPAGTWQRYHTGLRNRLQRPDLLIVTCGRYEPQRWREKAPAKTNAPLERFANLAEGFRDTVVRLDPA